MTSRRNYLANIILLTVFSTEVISHNIKTRALQTAHEKPQIEKWMDNFFGNKNEFDQTASLIDLLYMISITYLKDCTPIVLYDRHVEKSDDKLLQQLFKNAPFAFTHGQITYDYKVKTSSMLNSFDNKCASYILFLADVVKCKDIIGEQNVNKVVVVSRSSQWRVNEFLSSEASQCFVNLLIISPSDTPVAFGEEAAYVLYTHKLYIDGLGSNEPMVLTSWINGSLTRPHVSLFPEKMKEGFSGHRFIISLAPQPPFVIKRGIDENDDVMWDGTEVRLVKLLSEIYNFTTDFRASEQGKSPVSAVVENVEKKKANLGLCGIYITPEKIGQVDLSHSHSQDCASFISLTSTALPRYRAIMGPFHWTVWLALTMAYLLVIIPLAFSDKHTLKHLLTEPGELENMFWYVFGTFTNCFTFGKQSWTKSLKLTTRVLIGFYWMFTIITTACYTGSIIAFITFPIYPSTVDTVKQLLSGRYQIGTLDSGGWEYWFQNSSDPATMKLLKSVEFLPNIEAGLKNTTKAFFWPYAFLGSKAQLDYIVRTNFTTNNKKSLLHISSECFVPYGVGIILSRSSVYKHVINDGILQIVQSGFMLKFKYDVEWEIMRSATGKLLQASSGSSLKFLSAEDRSLSLDDTQGMFLLLGAGSLIAAASLFSEWLGGCFNWCKRKRAGTSSSLQSNPRTYGVPTPRQKLDSIQYSIKEYRMDSILDTEDDVGNHVDNTACDNHVDVVVHKDSAKSNSDSDTDFESQINRIFNFEELFGEYNDDTDTSKEELINEEEQSKRNKNGDKTDN